MESAPLELLRQHQQEHLLRWWSELSPDQQRSLSHQIRELDFPSLVKLFADNSSLAPAAVDRAQSPAQIVRLPATAKDRERARMARAKGEELLRAGKVGVLLVAGGQGTRLDFPHPKGMFPLGPASGKTLFQLLAEQVQARSQAYGKAIPYYIMTSDATHEETVQFFAENKHFGLAAGDVYFFRQGNMPAWDRHSGKLLLAEKDQLSTSPDGHGGLLRALSRNKLLADMRDRGVEFLFYHQVDNPLVVVADPEFLGHHVQHDAEVSTRVVAKLGPEEKMGIVADIDGQSQIIEYSDLPADTARKRDEKGELLFWAGSTAIHLFNVSFFERLVASDIPLPWHRAIKKVPYLDDRGQIVRPEKENAVKLERFIFDVLLQTRRSLVVEGARADEFHPLKNKSGDFSPEDVKQKITERSRRWLADVGAKAPAGLPVEVSPLYALDAAEFASRWQTDPRTPPVDSPWHIE